MTYRPQSQSEALNRAGFVRIGPYWVRPETAEEMHALASRDKAAAMAVRREYAAARKGQER